MGMGMTQKEHLESLVGSFHDECDRFIHTIISYVLGCCLSLVINEHCSPSPHPPQAPSRADGHGGQAGPSGVEPAVQVVGGDTVRMLVALERLLLGLRRLISKEVETSAAGLQEASLGRLIPKC